MHSCQERPLAIMVVVFYGLVLLYKVRIRDCLLKMQMHVRRALLLSRLISYFPFIGIFLAIPW